MNPWLETLIATTGGVLGSIIGLRLSKSPKLWWVGYALPLIYILAIGAASRWPQTAALPLMAWSVLGRIRYLVAGFAIGLLFCSLIPKLAVKRQRVVVGALTALAIFQYSIWPCLASVLNRDSLRALITRIDRDGVCLQNTAYTCGPSAAVTALRSLGIEAGEGDLALRARTSTATGTPPDLLAQAINEAYAGHGIKASIASWKDLEALRQPGVHLVIVKYSLMLDHWVVVREVTDSDLLVADPLTGQARESREDFLKRWRGYGVTLNRNHAVVTKRRRGCFQVGQCILPAQDAPGMEPKSAGVSGPRSVRKPRSAPGRLEARPTLNRIVPA